MKQNPLVSVIIPAHNRAELLTSRAIPSVLRQTYQNFEIIVVADRCTDDTRARVQKINDPRIKFIELTDRPPLPEDLFARWRVAAAAPRNRGLEVAKGEWICSLDDDDELMPNHIEILLRRALTGYDFVYGKFLMVKASGEQEVIGKYPPEHGHIATSSFLYNSKYKKLKYNTDATATSEVEDWNFCRRVIEASAKVSFVDEIVYILHRPIRAHEKLLEMLEWIGKRYLPWKDGSQLHYEHLHRYAYAAQFSKGKTVLDLACGEGYGSFMLAKEAEYVVGVEVNKQLVHHASSRYLRNNLEFIHGSILDVPIKDEKKFDIAVCFEGIENIEKRDKLLSEVKKLLKGEGLFIISTLNKAVYIDESQCQNPLHFKEPYLDEFKALLSCYFKNVHFLGQKVYTGSNIWNISPQKHSIYREFVVEKSDMEFYLTESSRKTPLYFIALASDAKIGTHILNCDSWLVDASDIFIKDSQKQIGQLVNIIQAKDSQIAELSNALQATNARLRDLEIHVQQMQHGIAMQLLNRYQKVAEKLLPLGMSRRGAYELGLTAIRTILNEGWKSFCGKAKGKLTRKTISLRRAPYKIK